MATTESRKPLCVVCGTGSAGLRHLRLIHHAAHVPVVALPVRPERRAELVALGFRVLENWAEVADLGATHAIIATDTRRHGEDVADAVKSGCEVLVEKPMTTDGLSAHAMVTTARAAGCGLWVACCLRFHEGLNNFRQVLPEIGRVHSVVVECRSYLPEWRPGRAYRASYSARAEDGGVLRDMIHEIDYCGWLFGWPQAVHARVRNLGRLGIASNWGALRAGVVVKVGLDYVSRPPQRWMRASGERGWLKWDGLTGTVTLADGDGRVQEISSGQTRDEMYLAQDLAFLRGAPGQPDPRFATDEDGMNALAVCDAARRASKS